MDSKIVAICIKSTKTVETTVIQNKLKFFPNVDRQGANKRNYNNNPVTDFRRRFPAFLCAYADFNGEYWFQSYLDLWCIGAQ